MTSCSGAGASSEMGRDGQPHGEFARQVDRSWKSRFQHGFGDFCPLLWYPGTRNAGRFSPL